MIAKATLFFFLLAGAMAAKGQALSPRLDTIHWNVEGMTLIQNDSLVQYACVWKTFGAGKVCWMQQGGDHITNFDVTNVSGQWPDTSLDGTIEYAVTFMGDTGSIRFSRAGLQTTVRMIFQTNGRDLFPWIYNVTSILPAQ